MIYLQLFLSFIQIGMFSFGGGMAAMPLIQAQVVDKHGWLTLTQFTDLITIAEMTPGPIAVNSATFVGTRVAGLPGALIATFGCILPACILVTFLAWLYGKYSDIKIVKGVLSGLRPAVVALIASAGCTIGALAFWGGEGIASKTNFNWIAGGSFFCALFVLRKFKTSPILVMIICGIVGGFIYR